MFSGKIKKEYKSTFSFESAVQKFSSLSVFDQHYLTGQCTQAVLEMLNSFSTGMSVYLPVQEHISFLFDLMEIALNIHGLIEFTIQVTIEIWVYYIGNYRDIGSLYR